MPGIAFDDLGRQCMCVDGQLRNCCRLREDWTSLSNDRKIAYIQAVKAVTSNPLYQPRYRDLMRLFAASADTLAQGRIAGTSLKLPWIRFFLQEYEDLLKMVDPMITIPFWDWTISNNDPYRHPVFNPTVGFGNSSNAIVKCVTSGPFRVGQFNVTPLAGGGCLTREYLQSTFLSRAGLVQVVLAHTAAQFNLFFDRIAFFPYLNVRCSVGGTICGDNAAEDPLYVLSAAFVDKVWDQWQKQSSDRLRVRYADDESILPLTDSLRVQEYHDNTNLPYGVSVCYGDLVAIGSRGAGGRSQIDYEGGVIGKGEGLVFDGNWKGEFLCAIREPVLEKLRLTDEELSLYLDLCLKRR